jgi:hypothetical protein
MDPITLIVAALAAGASAGTLDALKDDVKDLVKAAYAKLRGLAGKRVAGQPGAELVLAQHETDPQTWEAPLAMMLTEGGAADDANLVEAARALMELVDAVGTAEGKYDVTMGSNPARLLGWWVWADSRFSLSAGPGLSPPRAPGWPWKATSTCTCSTGG